jgi:hypothetical protein
VLFGHGCEPSASCAARQRWRCGRPSACACASCANETLAVFPLPCHPIAAEVLPRDPWPEKRSPSARHPFLIETLPNGQIRKSELINWGLAQKRRAQRITRGRRHLAGSGSVASKGNKAAEKMQSIHLRCSVLPLLLLVAVFAPEDAIDIINIAGQCGGGAYVASADGGMVISCSAWH